MPLFDHFRPPLKDRIQWNTVHSGWASRIADHLNTVLPPQFTMEEHVRLGGGVEIDVASYERYEDFTATNGHGPPTAMLTQRWAPPMPTAVGTGMFPDRFEVLIFDQDMGKQLVGAIEIISPGNKDRAEERTRFAAKILSYLTLGVSVVIIDPVTVRRANLHNEVATLAGWSNELVFPAEVALYSVAYRPVKRGDTAEVDVWLRSFAVGDLLPEMPLRLTGDLFVPVDFETTYTDVLRARRAIP